MKTTFTLLAYLPVLLFTSNFIFFMVIFKVVLELPLSLALLYTMGATTLNALFLMAAYQKNYLILECDATHLSIRYLIGRSKLVIPLKDILTWEIKEKQIKSNKFQVITLRYTSVGVGLRSVELRKDLSGFFIANMPPFFEYVQNTYKNALLKN